MGQKSSIETSPPLQKIQLPSLQNNLQHQTIKNSNNLLVHSLQTPPCFIPYLRSIFQQTFF